MDGRDVLLVHGDADRVASVDRVRAAANGLGGRSGLVTVRGGSHSMLRHHAAFDGLAARWVASSLLGDQPGAVLARVLAGEREVEA